LEGGVKFVKAGEIPKTASGKIKKRELRERAEREMVLEGRPMRFLNSLL
jgi:acyl-coenzyme A synthetase/AMP-(fatty) acid ligase